MQVQSNVNFRDCSSLVEIGIPRRRKYNSICFRTGFNTRDSIVQQTTLFIPDSVRRHIFLMYYRLSRARSRRKRIMATVDPVPGQLDFRVLVLQLFLYIPNQVGRAWGRPERFPIPYLRFMNNNIQGRISYYYVVFFYVKKQKKDTLKLYEDRRLFSSICFPSAYKEELSSS